MTTQINNPEEFQDKHPKAELYINAINDWGEAIQKAKLNCNIRTKVAGEVTLF